MKKRWMSIFLALFLLGCSQTQAPQTGQIEESLEEETTYDARLADSLDDAVLIRINEAKKELLLQNVESGRNYRLTYTGATNIEDPNGTQLVIGQLREGALLTIAFLHEKKEAKGIFLHEEADVYENVTQFSINHAGHKITFDGETYQFYENMPVVSDGEKIELMEVNDQDVLTVYAIGHTVYSIDIARGHGYLRLENAESFEEGWIELGQSFIRPITKDMLLTVPEGTYTMLLSKGDVQGSKDVTITKNTETSVDVNEVVPISSSEPARMGQLIFTISPESAQLYIDGQLVDYSDPVKLTYGLHKITCKAEGYATITKYFKVAQESASIDITMDKSQDSVSGNSTSSDENNNDSVSGNRYTTASTGAVVHIDAPTGAELYVDDMYVGLIPASFEKKEGQHTLSIRMSGYQTRSYTISLDGSTKDVTYSFSDLVKSTE